MNTSDIKLRQQIFTKKIGYDSQWNWREKRKIKMKIFKGNELWL